MPTFKQFPWDERFPKGRADLKRLRAMSKAEIEAMTPHSLRDVSDDFFAAAVVVPPVKMAISMRIDTDVLDWFKDQGPGYQTRMNAVLRLYMERMQQLSAPPTPAPASPASAPRPTHTRRSRRRGAARGDKG